MPRLARRSDTTGTSRNLLNRAAALTSWAKTDDPTARTDAGRRAFFATFEIKVDPTGTLDPETRARRATQLRRAHMLRLAARSAEVRRQRRDAVA